jgi:hypothetical protein
VADPTRRANHLRDLVSANFVLSDKTAQQSLRRTADYANDFIALFVARIARKNIPLAIFRKSVILRTSRLIAEGRTRRHERRVRDAMDVTATADGWGRHGRRNRVVLASRC